MHTRIFLIGFMGSGKSTLGAKLARRLDYQFIDMDQLIEETAELSIPEIFQDHGEAVFRKWEHDILLELCSRDKLVISTGGGTPCHSLNMDLMKVNGCTIYLNLSPLALKNRLIQSRTERPLIKGKTDAELLSFISALLGEREHFYRQAEHIADGLNVRSEDLAAILLDS